ncbi:MAG: FkbM family methyltransferase [Bacteroidota bacterium]
MSNGIRKLIKLIWSGDFRYLKEAYGQEGEDLVLLRFFGKEYKGFYVDIGAHHPKRFSNTYLLFKQGWQGINVDANPESIATFKKERPHDVNLTTGVAEKPGVLTFFRFDDPALNTFNEAVAKDIISKGKYQQVAREEVSVTTLTKILEANLPTQQVIDYLNIDVEGLDYQVLSTLDLRKFRPRIISVEDRGDRLINDATDRPVSRLLLDAGYEILAKTFQTYFFLDATGRKHYE